MSTESLKRIEPVAAPRPRAPIDLDFLSRQTMGDENLELEVLRMFDQMSHVYYERIETSPAVPDLIHHLHALKGAAAGVGAFGLSGLAALAETELRAGEAVNPERIDDVHLAVEEVSAFIAQRLRVAQGIGAYRL
jgi:HPt (histidine-containing phosphotransfer) domain-containing protein